MDEQRRLTELLATTVGARHSLLEAIGAGERLRDALLGEVLLGGLGGAEPGAVALQADRSGWPMLRLGDRYEIKLGKMMSPAARQGSNQVPYMKNANVQWGRLDLAEVDTMHIPEHEVDAYLLKVGDILACEGRHVGKSVLWRGEIAGACYQKALHRIRALDPEIDQPEFMLLCLRFYSVSGRFIREIGETTIPHLPAERLREIAFPFPAVEEQTAICALVGRVDTCISQIQLRTQALLGVSAGVLKDLEGSS